MILGFTFTDLLPTLVTLIGGWGGIEGLRFISTWSYNKIKRNQDSNHSEFSYVEQIASQSSQSLIAMNEKLLTIIEESADKSRRIDDLAGSVNKLNIKNGELSYQIEVEKLQLKKLKSSYVELIKCVEDYCECSENATLTRLRNEIQV